MKICIVLSNFYLKISNNLLLGAKSELKKNNINKFKIILVPGTFEIPYVIAKNIKLYDGFIALGCVIKGKTPHFEFLSASVFNALLQTSVTYKKPITNGIISCNNKNHAILRSSLNKRNKGREAAKALMSLLRL